MPIADSLVNLALFIAILLVSHLVCLCVCVSHTVGASSASPRCLDVDPPCLGLPMKKQHLYVAALGSPL